MLMMAALAFLVIESLVASPLWTRKKAEQTAASPLLAQAEGI